MRSKNPTCSGTIRFLHKLFARFDILHPIVSDNGTQFTVKEFTGFCKTFSIVHITTEPYHPRSNGQAERFVNIFK